MVDETTDTSSDPQTTGLDTGLEGQTTPATPGESTPKEKDKTEVLAAEVEKLRTDLQKAQALADEAMLQSRRAHQAADVQVDRLRKRLDEREKRLIEALPQLGLDAEQVRSFQEQRSRDDELEALQGEAARARAYDQQASAVQFRNQYVADLCKDVGADPNDPRLDVSDPDKFARSLCKNVGVDPDDPRLDKGDPNKFARSLLRIQREDVAKASEKAKGSEATKSNEANKGKTPPEHSARDDLGMLGGGGGAAPTTHDPYGDPGESLAKGLSKLYPRRA